MGELGLHIIDSGKHNGEVTQELVGYSPAQMVGLPPERVDVDDRGCFAKELTTMSDGVVKSSVYYLRMGVGGHLLDPWNMLNSGSERSYAKHAGKDSDKFVKVNERCFKFYMRYLTTRNSANYLNADRELFTG